MKAVIKNLEVVDVFRWIVGEEVPQWFRDMLDAGTAYYKRMDTPYVTLYLDNLQFAMPGHYIIRYSSGRVLCVDEESFHATYATLPALVQKLQRMIDDPTA